MDHFVGLDVSLKETSICVIAATGVIVWQGGRASDPDALATALRRSAPNAGRVAIERGPASTWLWHELRARGIPVVCLDARHAHAALRVRARQE